MPATVEMASAPKVETTRPRRIAPTTTSRKENMTTSGLPTPDRPNTSSPAQQVATVNSHNAASPQCSAHWARLRRLTATNIGPTSSTPALVLPHQRIQRSGSVPAIESPARRKPSNPSVGTSMVPMHPARMNSGTSRARPKPGSKPRRSRIHVVTTAPAAIPRPTPSEAIGG
jgi:hypothetical protein